MDDDPIVTSPVGRWPRRTIGFAHEHSLERRGVRTSFGPGSGTLAVACPYCTVMLADGVQSTGDDLRVVDVATLLAESID